MVVAAAYANYHCSGTCDWERVANTELAQTCDAVVMVADAFRLRSQLGWKPQHDDLLQIVGSAYFGKAD